jgi:hypothetical protein
MVTGQQQGNPSCNGLQKLPTEEIKPMNAAMA